MFTGLLQKANRPLLSAQRISLTRSATHSSRHLNSGLITVGYRLKSALLEGSSSSQQEPKSVFELGAQLERQNEIIKHIKSAKQNILEKQSLGRQLALNVAYRQTDLNDHINSTKTASPQVNILEKRQRYHMFIEKMLQLYKSEKRLTKKRNQAYARMELSPVQSLTPIKACLFEYSRLSTNGFNCGVLAESLKRLNQAVTAVGNNPLTFSDYTLSEMDQSWRMDKLTEDLKFGLDVNPNVFFSPHNLAEVSRQLGYLGYKNSEIIPKWFEKIDSMLTEKDTQKYIETAKVSFSQAMFGGQKGFVPRHYIYQGFSNSEEFKSHVETLLMYEHDKETALNHKVNSDEKGASKSNLIEVKRAAQQLIEAANEVKDMQQEMEAAVRSVRTQYHRLKEAHDQHAFLKENKYIHLDLLELQELLIKAGYLQPDEQVVNKEVQVGALGMDAAVEVFYELVLNYHPEALSPQYDSFYDAVKDLQKSDKTSPAAKEDRNVELNLHTLSSALIGIEKQAMSFRRDIKDDDYPTEFYQKLLNAEDEWLNRHEHSMNRSLSRLGQKCLAQNVKMERTYLNGWRTFFENTKNLPTRMEEMLRKGVSQEDCYTALRALNVCRFQAEGLRDKISSKFASLKNTKRCTDQQALVDGILGLAGCSYKPKNANLMVQRITGDLLATAPFRRIGQSIAPKVRMIDRLTFLQAVELLQGLTTPGFVRDEKEFNQCVEILCERINHMSFGIIANELKFDEFNALYNAYVNLKFSEVKKMRDIHKSHFTNETLVRAFEQKSYTELQYEEASSAKYDPLKPRVIGGLTESLIKADLNHLHIIQDNETQGMFREMYPYVPDVLMGYEGQKVGIFVLNNDQIMRDTLEVDGFTQAKMALVESAHRLNQKVGTSQIKSLALPVRRVVDADLQNHKLSLRSDFSLDKFLEESGLANHIKDNRIDTRLLSKFATSIFEKTEENLNGNSGAFEEFLVQLLHLMRIRDKMDSVFEQEQILSAIDELKLQMLKLLMMEATLSIHEKNLIRDSLPEDIKSFENLINQGLLDPITKTQKHIKSQLEKGVENQKGSSFWQGVRQEVEVPIPVNYKVSDFQPKNIIPELLNQKFLWHETYHHYSDWESKMSQAYDQFNLLELPQGNKDEPKYSFLERDFKRRVPRGIFPCAKSPRTVLSPPNAIEVSSREALSLMDPFSKYERSPMQTMIKNELAKNSELIARGVTSEITSITNLQNIKHSLKSDATDHQICDLLFNKLSFTDRLIEEHLGQQRQGSATFLQRDPESFRQFLNKQHGQDGIISPYDHFYIREAVRKGNPEEIYAKMQELNNIHPPLEKKEYDTKMGELNKQLEDCLLNYKNSIEDKFNLSKALDNHLEVNIDVGSLSSVQKRNQSGLSPADLEMAPEIFLQKQRCRAEANLIKARIVYKMHSDVPLSDSEKKYMSAWIEKAAQTSTLLSQADVLVPQHPSSLSLADALSAEDFYALNSLSRVSISNEQKEIALNDLVLELINFVDADTVRKVELSLLEDTLKKKWMLADDFRLVEQRNKEIDLVMHQMEEIAWRTAAVYDAQEKKYIEDMVFVDRGLDAFDNAFLEIDRQSFSAFFDEANNFDSRVNLLENWMCRKDEEIRSRVTLPTPELAKSDQTLFQKYDAPLKKARESLLGQILTIDEFGKDRIKKAYSELTSRELHLITESLCVRLNLFQQKHPAFLPQVVKALMEHPNLANSDRYQMEGFCKLFELDWRGDSALQNREQFMMSNPVYMKETDRSSIVSIGAITNESVLEQIRQACKPFLPTLISKMRQAK